MNKRILLVTLLTASLMFLPAASFSGTSFIITPNDALLGPFAGFFDISGVQEQYATFAQNFVSKNDTVIATGMALANTLGYPNGKSIIGVFPHFEVGVAAGVGVYQYKRYKDFDTTNIENNPVVPGGGLNGSVHFGTGISDDMDITFKVFVFGPYYKIEKNFSKDDPTNAFKAKLTKNDVYSFGAKVRYNLLKETKLVPFVLSFGGITVNLGLDYMKGDFRTDVTYSTTKNVTIQFIDPFGGTTSPASQTTDLRSTVNGTANISWNFISLTPEAFVYIDLFYLFSIYTGPSITLTAGQMRLNVKSKGVMQNVSPIVANASDASPLVNIPALSDIAYGQLVSDEKWSPKWLTPKWVVGLEINLLMVKIQAEVASILTDYKQSAIAQVGIRAQF